MGGDWRKVDTVKWMEGEGGLWTMVGRWREDDGAGWYTAGGCGRWWIMEGGWLNQ
ncbi:MAG: hypothetical protein ACK55I_18125 [bacterium]